MTSEAKQRLVDVLEACQAVGRFVEGKDFEFYQNDEPASPEQIANAGPRVSPRAQP